MLHEPFQFMGKITLPLGVQRSDSWLHRVLLLSKIFPAVLFGAYAGSSRHRLSVVFPSSIAHKSGKKAFLTDLVISPIVCNRFAWEIDSYRKV